MVVAHPVLNRLEEISACPRDRVGPKNPARWRRSGRRALITGAGAAALLFQLAPAWGDTLYLRDGEKLVGKVITDEKTEVVIESKNLGRVKIPRDRIEQVELDPPPLAQPATTTPDRPFVPPPPELNPPASSTAAVAPTNAPAKRRWFWQAKKPVAGQNADWIQLKSGEWLRGRLYGMQGRDLEFESDELDDLTFDWKDVYQLVAPRALVSYGERESAWGSVRVDREKVTVSGVEAVSFPRYDLVGIAPGSPRELDYWSGRFSVGLNLRAGNTEQADFLAKLKLERRTPNTHLELDYNVNYSQLEGVESVNNQRASELFDVFLTRRLFLRVPQAEYYSDVFQNIDYRVTAGGGAGYYLVDTPRTEWLVAAGPAYQVIRFDNVPAGSPKDESTPAFFLQSNYDVELTKRVDLELDYQAIVANEDSGGITHHATAAIVIELTRVFDLDITFTWDRISNPQPDASGQVPEQNDYRLNLSLGLKY